MKITSHIKISSKFKNSLSHSQSQKGFTIVEATIALTILIIVLVAVVGTVTFAIKYNRGNDLRTQSLAVLQEKVEKYRSAKFTPTVTDSILLGGTKPNETPTVNGIKFLIQSQVDDDPATTDVDTNTSKTLKEITVTVTPITGESSWITAVPTKVVFRRVKAN